MRSWSVIALMLLMSSSVVPATGAPAADASLTGAALYAVAVPHTQPGQSATLLPDGNWLLLGGLVNGQPTATAVLYSPPKGITTGLIATLGTARAWHTTTVLPDGQVLVFGGIDKAGKLLASAELYSPATQTFSELPNTGLEPRAHQVTNLLTDGTVLIAGGESLVSAQLWDPNTNTTSNPNSLMVVPRSDAMSALLGTGPVLISGGTDARRGVVDRDELYLPTAKAFESADTAAAWLPALSDLQLPAQVAETLPAEGSSNVPVGSRIVVRFTQPMAVRTLDSSTVVLIGPAGSVSVNIVPAEAGTLLFVSPKQELLPGAYYTLFIRGATDVHERGFPALTLGFATATLGTRTARTGVSRSSTSLPGLWQPPHLGQPWLIKPTTPTEVRAVATPAKTSRPTTNTLGATKTPRAPKSPARPNAPAVLSPAATEAPASNTTAETQLLQAPPGITALAGQVLLQNGQPLPGVAVSATNQTTKTDGAGRFLLTGLAAGHVQFIVDGRTANAANVQYGQFVIGADVVVGTTTALGYTIWMPVIDTAHAVSIPSPTTQEVRVTSPLLPGVVLKIPAGAVIREPNGKIATSVSLTAVPLDRSPFPTPAFSMYFVIQPGGAVIESATGQRLGAQLVYPNPLKRPRGAPSHFMYYDPSGSGWTNYGTGHVADSGDRVDPDQDTRLYGFSGFGDVEAGNPPPPVPPPPDGCHSGGSDPNASAGGNASASGSDGVGTAGEPVDCATGLFLYSHVDLVVKDTIPIVIQRTYQSSDTYPRNFGVGFFFDYALWLYSTTGPFDTNFTTLYLILPNGSQIPFTRTAQSSQTGLAGLQMVASGNPTQYVGATITYDGTAYLVMTTKDGTQYRFNASDGRFLRSITNRNGQVLQVVAATSQTGENTPIVTLNSPNGRWVQIQYAGAVGSYPAGTSMIASVTDDSGRSVSYSYDTSNRLTKVTYPDGGSEQFTYDGTSSRIASVILPSGQTKVANLYDANQRVKQQTLADGGIYKFAYMTNGNGQVTQTTVTDPNNNVRVAQLNSAGYVTSNTVASGTPVQAITTYQRDPSTNLITSRTDALNRTSAYTYDSLGNPKSVTLLSGTSNAVTYSYTYTSTFNELATVTDPLNHKTTYAYDSFGDLTTITDPLNNKVATISYNTATGLPTQITDALNHTTKFGYQGSDLISVTDALSRKTNLSVDALGRVVVATNPLGEAALYSWNFRDQVTQQTDPLGNLAALTYDLDGNLKSVTDARNGVTQFTYDAKDRLKTHIDQLNHSESYSYDHNDNLVNRTDRKGQQQILSFDALNRLSQIQYKTTSGSVESTVGYTYDAGNRATKIADSASGTMTRGYDGLDRLTSETTPNGSTGYQYDSASRRTQLTVSGQSAAITYGYDADNQLLSVTQGSGSVAIGYDKANRRATLTLPNGIKLAYGYDNASELTGLTYTLGSNAVGTLTYGYDLAGHRTSRGGTLDATNLPTVVSATTYNAANQLTGWSGSTLSYDNNGNLTSSGSTNYTWNTRNQLVGISGAATASFVYDAVGRRQTRTVSGASTGFVYDGPNLVQEVTGATPSANYLTGLGIDETFSRTDASSTQSYLTDALKSVLALTSSAGTIATSYNYDPYGAASAGGTASANALQYTGRDNDGTGLYYYRARYYSPQFARFISEDPLGISAGPNSYAYARGNPISLRDPLGLWTLQVGLTLNVQLGFVNLNGTYGIVADTNGNIGGYVTGGLGGGVGANAFGGLNVAVSNGDCIQDIGGPFGNVSASIGAGVEGGVDAFAGQGSHGQSVAGAGFSVGTGAGADYSIGGSDTKVYPLWP